MDIEHHYAFLLTLSKERMELVRGVWKCAAGLVFV